MDETTLALKELNYIFAHPTEEDLRLAEAVRAAFDDQDFWDRF